jgi:hypothetical protein
MVTFSKEKGLVEAGGDDGSIRGVHDIWFYIYIAGYFPLVHTTIIRVSHLLRVNWGNTWRKALALLSRDQTSRLKQKNLFDVSKSIFLFVFVLASLGVNVRNFANLRCSLPSKQ